MTETTTTTETTVETPVAAEAPKVETRAKAKKAKGDKAPRKAPQIKLSARQRTNVDAFDNGANTSAGAINAVLLAAKAPMTRDEITAAALKRFASRFDKLKAPGRVSNHLRHLLKRSLIENVGGAWRVRPDARALLKKGASKKDDSGAPVEGTAETAAE